MPASTSRTASTARTASASRTARQDTISQNPGGGLAHTNLGTVQWFPTQRSLGYELPFSGGYTPNYNQVPSGDVNITGWTLTGAATATEAITDGTDTKYLTSPNSATSSFVVNLPAPVDANGVTVDPTLAGTSTVITLKAKRTVSSGTGSFKATAQVFAADGTTALTNAVATSSNLSGAFTQYTITLTNNGVSGWATAQLKLTATYTPGGAPGATNQASISEVSIEGRGAKVDLDVALSFKAATAYDGNWNWVSMTLAGDGTDGQPGHQGYGGWRSALPTWRTENGTDRVLLGSALDLEPNTEYEIKMVITESVGGASATLAFTSASNANFSPGVTVVRDTNVKTLAEPTALVAGDRYVDPINGRDAVDAGGPYDGQAATVGGGHGPWRTTDYAINRLNAGDGTSAILVPGFHPAPITKLTHADTTIRFQTNPAVTSTGRAPIMSNDSYTALSPDIYDDATRADRGRPIMYEYLIAPLGANAIGAESAADATGDSRINYVGGGQWTRVSTVDSLGRTHYAWRTTMPTTRQVFYCYFKQVASLTVSGTDPTGTPSGGTLANYRAAKGAVPYRCEMWDNGVPSHSPPPVTLGTWQGWAEIRDTNLSPFHSGVYQQQAAADLYVWLPGGIDPRTCYMWLGTTKSGSTPYAIVLNGPRQTVDGLEFRAMPQGVRVERGAPDAHINRCFSVTGHELSYWNGGEWTDATTPGTYTPSGAGPYDDAYVRRCVVENCYGFQNGSWSLSGEITAPWKLVKVDLYLENGQTYGVKKVLAGGETMFVHMASCCKQSTVRYCTIEGIFNGCSTGGGGSSARELVGIDIHDNNYQYVLDNLVEPDQSSSGVGAVNIRAWNLIAKNCKSFWSADSGQGPQFMWNCSAFEMCNWGASPDGSGNSDQYSGPGNIMKMGNTQVPVQRIFMINNTVWTSRLSVGSQDPAVQFDGLTGSPGENYYWRNNILRTRGNILDQQAGANPYDMDYDLVASTNGTMKYSNTLYNTLAAFRTAIAFVRAGNGTNLNKIGSTDYEYLGNGTSSAASVLVDAGMNNTATGDITLKAGSAIIASGVAVPNIRDIQKPAGWTGTPKRWMYLGSAPCRGYAERT